MKTKELIFNGKKFFEGQEPSYVGKTITVPNNHGLTQFVYGDGIHDGYGGLYSLPLKKSKVVAETAIVTGSYDGKPITDRWVCCDEVDSSDETIWRRVGEILEIGGGIR